MPKKSQETFSFPRGPLTMGNAVEEAVRALRAEYDHDVAVIADDAATRIDSGELADPVNFHAWLKDKLIASRRVKELPRAVRGLLVSPNASLSDLGNHMTVDEAITYAMWDDVYDALDERGYEVEDAPDDFDLVESDDDEEEGEEEARS